MTHFKNDWWPTAEKSTLQLRAQLLTCIRQFFADRYVLEVETPLLSQATVSDLHLQSFYTHYHLSDSSSKKKLYLQTSPEFAMKRLLAAGSGAIYQLCKAFRDFGESGRYHNPEFTLLEWYRPGFNHHDLMDEVESLLKLTLNCSEAQRLSYSELFQHYLKINPHHSSVHTLKQVASHFSMIIADHSVLQRDDWLTILMTHGIEPKLPKNPVFIYDFPASQAALAKIRPGNPALAERFEVYVEGLELANGFHELCSATEQRSRFDNDLIQRKKSGHSLVPIDEHLLAALEHGLPDCAGVALGIDRLVMLAAKQNNINHVLTFPIARA